NNSASASTEVLTPPSLSIAKVGPTRAFAGENVPYMITVQNTGGAPATHVVLSDLLPSREFFVGQAQSAGPAVTLTNAGNQVTYTVTLANKGPSDAQSVHFADVLPSELTPVSFTQQSGPDFSLSFNGDHVYNAGRSSLGAGATAVFIVTATVNASVPQGTVV